MNILASVRAGALVSVSVLALALTACMSDDDVATSGDGGPVIVGGGAPAMSAGDHGSMGDMHAANGVHMPLFDNLGTHTHKISTTNAEAQAYFNQGYRYLFNFNHNAAILSFQEALKRDPNCAMCWWGIAFAYGPNINMPMMPEAIAPAYAAAQKAAALAPGASPTEQAYIGAIVKRYSNDPKADRQMLDRAFASAMRKVAHDYPDDLDAATLYAEALMDTSAWNYWQADHRTANPGLEELVPTIEAVLKRDPNHPGAEHLYIHAVEASDNPGRAEHAADLLEPQMPGAGHLVHMPSHIYNRIGRYADGVHVNQVAAKSDEAYFAATNDRGLYAAMYYVHNLHFTWTAASTEGRSAIALDFAHQVVAATPAQMAHDVPAGEVFLPTVLYAELRFGKWDAVLAEPKPDPSYHLATAMWHYAQARALAAKGQMAKAKAEQALILPAFPASEAERYARFDVPGAVMVQIAAHVAEADIARAQHKAKDEVAELQTAVKLQDGIKYMEPPYWDFPVRENLGAALLDAGRAKEAEAVYREDLKEWTKNGWSLMGLSLALAREGRKREAAEAHAQFEEAWARADVKLTGSRF